MDAFVDNFQSILDLEPLHSNPVFQKDGQGSTGLGGLFIGFIMGISLCSCLCSAALLWYPHPAILTTSSAPGLYFETTVLIWSSYSLLLSIFHALEFLVTAWKQPRNLSYDSLIINHSTQYTLAFIASALEFWIESILFGTWKFSFRPVIAFGLSLMLLGQVVRTVAMW
jgi:hypothetical protein